MYPKIIGIVGFLGSGKDTAASFLIEDYNYKRDSFAAPLKDAVAPIFDWPRELLEGNTEESRQFREKVDTYWANKLEDPKWTPRKALQIMGTDVMRNNLHENIWVLSLMKRVKDSGDNVVITDCRFPNEIKAIKDLNGMVMRIKRGPEPDWYEVAEQAMTSENSAWRNTAINKLEGLDVHPSEYSWIGSKVDVTIENDGTIEDLRNSVIKVLEDGR